MQITQTNGAGYIWTATSDCGRIQYLPIGNDRLIIDGRDAYRGRYMDYSDAKRPGREAVESHLWDAACKLMQEVDDHNVANLDAARKSASARDIARYESLSKAMAGTRGTYTDDNTF